MKYLAILCTVLVVAVFAMGCSDQKMPTISEEPSGSATLTKGPANSGPIVMRSQTTFAVFYVDARAGLLAIHGADIVQFCQGNVSFDLVDLLSVDVPEYPNRLNVLMKGTVTTSVWPFTVFDCNAFLMTTPLATGTAKLVNTDNDLVVFLNPSNVNANAFGFTAQGNLTRPDGSQAKFNGVNRSVWDGVNISSLKTASKINLN